MGVPSCECKNGPQFSMSHWKQVTSSRCRCPRVNRNELHPQGCVPAASGGEMESGLCSSKTVGARGPIQVLWELGAVLAGFWVLGFWVLGFWVLGLWVLTLGCWCLSPGGCVRNVLIRFGLNFRWETKNGSTKFKDLAEGKRMLSSPCGAAWDLPES